MQVETAAYVSCALKVDGSVVCWGQSDSQLHYSTWQASATGLASIALSDYYLCGLKAADGSAVCFGIDNYGVVSTVPTGSGYTRIVSGTENAWCAGWRSAGGLRDYFSCCLGAE